MNIQTTFEQLLDTGRRVVAVDQALFDNPSLEAFARGVETVAAQTQVSCFAVEIDQLDKISMTKLLQSAQRRVALVAAQPGYRAICEQLEQHDRGALFIRNAHEMDAKAVQFLAQLLRFMRNRQLNWTLVLSIDSGSANLRTLGPLDIALFFTEQGQHSGKRVLASPEEQSPVAGRPDHKPVVVGLALVFAMAVLFWTQFSYQWGSDPSNLTGNDPDAAELDFANTSISGTIVRDTPAPVAPSASEPVSELNAYLQQLAAREQQFESQLAEFREQNQQPAPPGAVQSASVKPIARAYRGDKRLDPVLAASLLSTELTELSAMIDSGKDFGGANQRGENALIIAVLAGRDDVLDKLLALNLAVDHGDEHGRTALYYAAVAGNRAASKLLLEAGANLNAQTKLQKTPLMAATHNGHVDVVTLLLEEGADPNLQDHSGWSALFYSVWDGRREISSLLRAYGARGDLTDQDGYTPAQISALRRRTGG